MKVYIDAHTHNLVNGNSFSVVNLSLDNASEVLQSSDHLYFSIGIHPWDVASVDIAVLQDMELLLADSRIMAIGECGFDRNAKATIREQVYYFERQVQLSEKFNKPLIIHCVAAFNELIVLRKRLKPTQNWIIHGFRSKPEMAKQLLDNGFFLSYGQHFNPFSVALTPIDRLCIETDESEMDIVELYKTIASIKNCQPSELNAACELLRLYVC